MKASVGGSTYGGFGTTTMASWKVPEIEQINRNFNENARFFTTSKNERRHGLKYVPPPVAENVQQLLEEKAAAEMSKNNYLLNSRFVRGTNNTFNDEEHYNKRSSSEARAVLDHEGILEETRSIISQMSRDGGRRPAYTKKVAHNNRSSVFKTPDNARDVIRTSAGNLRDQIFQHLDAASRSDGGYE